MMGYAIETEDVVKTFQNGRVVAVDGISIKVRDGEFFSILGPSGCGKTTLLRIIHGLEVQDRGNVYINGKLVNDVPPHKRDVTMVFQNLALFPHKTVFDNIAFGLKIRRFSQQEIRRRVRRTLELVGLRPDIYEKRYPHQLSGGEQQRVALARALAVEPSVILFDEPLSNVDKRIRDRMRIELRRLQKEVGFTALHVTHDQEVALSMSDRIAIMRGGRIVQVGAPDKVYMRPADSFVATFLGDANLIDGVVEEIRGEEVRLKAGGLTIRAVGKGVTVGSVVKLCVRPERVRVGAEPLGTQNDLDGVVRDVEFVGDDIIYRVEVSKGILIEVSTKNAGMRAFKLGDRVRVGWNAEDAYFLSD